MCGACRGDLPYESLWCEHHEDFLANRKDGRFDAFQVKTRRPQKGDWRVGDSDFHTALKGFIRLDDTFGDAIASFRFYSNLSPYAPTQPNPSKISLLHLKEAIGNASSIDGVDKVLVEALETLAEKTGKDTKALFNCFKKLGFQKGPSLDDFEAVIAHTHLPSMNEVASATPAQLNSLAETALQRVCKASCRTTNDPSKHYYCLREADQKAPLLAEKEITVEDFRFSLLDKLGPPFRWAQLETNIDIKHNGIKHTHLDKKLLQGGLRRELSTFQRRTLSAHGHLLKLQHSSSAEEFCATLNQLENVVQAECDDARLFTEQKNSQYGKDMLHLLQKRLRELAENKPESVCNQDYNVLVGMAGLLTADCRVWWSDEFDLECES